MTDNVTNGTASHILDTTSMNVGQYNLNLAYTGNNNYNHAVNNSCLTINNPDNILVNCEDTAEWMCQQDALGSTTNPQLDSDGYITNIYSYFTTCTYPILKNMRLTAVLRTNYNSQLGWGITYNAHGVPNRYWVYGNTLEEAHTDGGQSRNKTITKIQTNTDTTLVFIVDEDGYISYQDSNNTTPSISNSAFTDNELSNMYFRFRHWNGSGRISCKELTIEYNFGGE